MPTGKIGVYTRFFEYANFRLPLSTFLVNVLKLYRIHISQLSVIGAAKVSHFEILCRVHGFEPTVGLFRCFYVNSKNKGKSVPKDPFPKSFEFNAEHYATLVAYPAPFHKYPKLFLCLVGMSCNYTLDENTYPEFLRDNDEEMDLLFFIRTADPTKVRIARAESELEASVDKLFNEGGSGNQVEQGDSASGGGRQGINIRPVTEITDTVAETVIPLKPRHPKKMKNIVADAGGPLHPPKKLREDHETPSGAFVGGKSRSAVQRLLAEAVQNAEVKGGPIPTLPFVTSSVSATPEPEGWRSHRLHESEVDSFSRLVELITPVTNGSRLDDGRVCCEMVDGFAPSKFFALIRVMEHDQLFMKFNVGAARQMSLSAKDEVKNLKEHNTILEKEKSELGVKVADLAASIKVREPEVADLDVVVTSVKSQNDNLVNQVHELEASSTILREKVTVYKNCTVQLKKFQDEQIKVVNDKVDKLYTDFI
ncbi:hypothetical protein Tco_0194927 [Tanacetum coccineum]